MHRLLMAGLVVTLLASLPVAAQTEEALGPVPIEPDDLTLEEPIVPLGPPAQATFTGRVGCEAVEPPGTITHGAFTVPHAPAFVNTLFAPTSQAWVGEPGDCAPDGPPPYEINVTLAIALNQNAPAFQPFSFPVHLHVTKTTPGTENTRTYGPGWANVTVTPGYFPNYDVRTEHKVDRAPADGTAFFNATIQNLGNGETRFQLEAIERPPRLDVDIEPSTLTLAPNATGNVTIRAQRAATPDAPGAVEAFKVHLTSGSTHPDGGAGPNRTLAFQAGFRSGASELLPAPAPSAAWSGGLVALAALVLRRRQRPACPLGVQQA